MNETAEAIHAYLGTVCPQDYDIRFNECMQGRGDFWARGQEWWKPDQCPVYDAEQQMSVFLAAQRALQLPAAPPEQRWLAFERDLAKLAHEYADNNSVPVVDDGADEAYENWKGSQP